MAKVAREYEAMSGCRRPSPRSVEKVGPYNVRGTIGTGASAVVKLGEHETTQELAALKMISLEELEKQSTLRQRILREVAIMRLLDHPNILKLYNVIETDTHMVLVLEYIDGGELFHYLVDSGRCDEQRARSWFQQIMAGVKHCHDRHVCHRDLKPENVLISRDRSRVVIADFGLSSTVQPLSMLESSCGSPHYAAPEIISGSSYSGPEVDVWSCGVILYVLVTGTLPFDDDNFTRLLRKVQLGRFVIPSYVSERCARLIRRTIVTQPAMRYTVADIVADEWLNMRPVTADMGEVCAGGVAPECGDNIPVALPDEEIVRILSHMGWGEEEDIVEDLRADERTVTRELYHVLVANRERSREHLVPLESFTDSDAGLEERCGSSGSDKGSEKESTDSSSSTSVERAVPSNDGSLVVNTSASSSVVSSPRESSPRGLQHALDDNAAPRSKPASAARRPPPLFARRSEREPSSDDAFSFTGMLSGLMTTFNEPLKTPRTPRPPPHTPRPTASSES